MHYEIENADGVFVVVIWNGATAEIVKKLPPVTNRKAAHLLASREFDNLKETQP